jgi:succinoglycan biosynthesis transport protein ExoP
MLRVQIGLAVAFLRRQYLVVLACVVLSAILGTLYLLISPTSFTASAVMMIDTSKDLSLPVTLSQGGPTDSAWIESQVGILKSASVAATVVKQLHLAEDLQFTEPDAGIFDKLLSRLGWNSEPPKTDAERAGQAVGAVLGGLQVKRLGPSYLIQINFSSHNREVAIKIANAMIDAYAFEQLNAKYQANRRAGDWLQDRLQTLREQAANAERAVIEFRAKNNIVAAGGRLIYDQQLGDLNTQLAAARARTTEVVSRLSRMEAIIRANEADPAGNETVSETLGNSIITNLRSRYLELVNREADWSVKYGKNHSAVVSLRNQMRDMRGSILDELRRISETYKSEYKIAQTRQEDLEKQLAAVVSQSQDTNQAQIALHSLESAALSYRKIYDDFLQRHTEGVQRQSFPITDARLVSSAGISKVDPQKPFVLLMAMLAGGALGIGLGFLRELFDHVFRTSGQVQSVLETRCLALVPLLKGSGPAGLLADQRSSAQRVAPKSFRSAETISRAVVDAPPLPDVKAVRPINLTVNLSTGAKSTISVGGGSGRRRIRLDANVLRTVVDAPSSQYADAIRSIRLTVDLDGGAKSRRVIGLTSCLPHEGKSTVAAGIAQLMAKGGARVILVDCDLRNPSLSRALAPGASVGFHDVVARRSSLEAAVWIDPATNLAFLPALVNSASPNPTEVLASETTKWLFEALQTRYDYVIVDLPPLAPVVDVRATTRLIDAYILVIEWGRTKVDAVQHALSYARDVQENIIGAVLNKVDMDAMSRYDGYGSSYYNYGGYYCGKNDNTNSAAG